MTTYLNGLTPTCLFTIQLSLGYDSLYNFHWATMTIKGSLQASIPVVKAFLAGFWSKIWLGHVTCKYGVGDDPIFAFPDLDLPIHYTTFIVLQ